MTADAMENLRKALGGIETKIFDPRDPVFGNGAEVLDACLAKRDDQWWMYLAGQPHGYGPTQLFSASLEPHKPLSATGWKLTRDDSGKLVPLAGQGESHGWDGAGGRHCPSYVRGWDPHTQQWVQRIYYAGSAQNLWGPYAIGFLQWDGERWIDRTAPVILPTEAWEHGSVYEPNLMYHEGKWKLWYVAGSNGEDYLVHGYAESDDGATGWSSHTMFAPPEMKMFDFFVRERAGSFEAIFSRVWLGDGAAPPTAGLWWCRADKPSKVLSDWGRPVQIMTAEDRGWHSGPWKPSFHVEDENPNHGFVFFDGAYRTSDPGPFPFAFTLGCFEFDLSAIRNGL